MPDIKGFLIDLGGVVYQGSEPIAGSIEAVNRLREAAIPFRFLTNTTSRPKRSILGKLRDIGLPVEDDDLFTPAEAARAYIIEHGLKPHFLIAPALEEDFADMPAGAKPAVIIGDAGDGFTYRNMNLAFRQLEAGAELVALANNRKFVGEDGEMCLDVGAFVAALEFGSGKRATVLGKPSADFFRLAVNSMDLEAAETAMIGDDAEFDASAAVEAGLVGVLVHTGKWQPGAADSLDPKPAAEFDNLKQAIDHLLRTT
jgi:HAD superfamily hydrolase (TIGR01458 family)